jgi:dienelactone hydrolase
MGGYLARPAGSDKRPGVIVWMEIFGINSHIRDVVERVAGEGYCRARADFFHRTGPGVEYNYDDAGMAGGMKLLMKLDCRRDDRRRARRARIPSQAARPRPARSARWASASAANMT